MFGTALNPTTRLRATLMTKSTIRPSALAQVEVETNILLMGHTLPGFADETCWCSFTTGLGSF